MFPQAGGERPGVPRLLQTAALLAPPLSAAMIASRLSALISGGRAPRRLRRLAAARPVRTRSWASERLYCASAPKMEMSSPPCRVVVSICSIRLQKGDAARTQAGDYVRRARQGSVQPIQRPTTMQSPVWVKARARARPGGTGAAGLSRNDAGHRRPPRERHRAVRPWSGGDRPRRRAPGRPTCTERLQFRTTAHCLIPLPFVPQTSKSMTSFRVIRQDGDGNHTTPDQWVGRRIRGEDRARPRKRTLRKDQDAVGWAITGTPRQRPEGFADVVSLLGCCARRKKVRQHSAN